MATEESKEHILPMLNPYSYHIFEQRGEKFLFDVNTTAFSLVDDVTYRTLELAGKNTRIDTAKIIDEEFSPGSFAVVDGNLDKMRCSGFFSVPPIDMRYQQEQLNHLWRHRPRRLQLFVAQVCNLKCKYCYAESNGSNSRQKLMSDDVAFAGVDYLIRRSGNRKDLLITFFGGEPTLNFGLIEKVVAYCEKRSKEYKKNFSFELITNGSLLDKEMMDFVLDRDFLLFVSIDGWRAMHNHQRPSVTGEDYFDKIIYNAQYLVNGLRERHSKLKVKIRANLTSDYYDVKSVANFLESFGFDYIGIGAILPLSWNIDSTTPMAFTSQQLSEFESMQEEMLLQALADRAAGKRPGAYINRLLNKCIDNCKNIRSTMGITCGIGRNTNAVDTDGNIFPCHRYVGMDNYILGNVFDGLDYKKTMGKYQAYNRNAVEMCSRCWARNICAGGCPWDISCPDGNICKRPKEECERRLRGLERDLWFYKEARRLLPSIFKDMDPKEDPYWISRTK